MSGAQAQEAAHVVALNDKMERMVNLMAAQQAAQAKIAADKAAVDVMRNEINLLNIDGKIVIGEGELDQAPMLYIGEELGTNWICLLTRETQGEII